MAPPSPKVEISEPSNILAGLNGNDLFLGGAGSDYIDGGLNTDTASYVGSNAGVTVNLALAGAHTHSQGAAAFTLGLILAHRLAPP